ncbi:MAG: hypothetical protein NXH97_09860 [Rhodobacteraceae bacterium]|nr:hypothetical protein [Paracoccaceae bacterium]
MKLALGGGAWCVRCEVTERVECELSPEGSFRFQAGEQAEIIIVRNNNRLAARARPVDDAYRNQSNAREVILERLPGLLSIEASRDLPDEGGCTGPVRGLADDKIVMAIRRLHEDPKYGWKIDELSREAARSQSAVFPEFNRMVGMAPMECLQNKRMTLAKDPLCVAGTLRHGQRTEIGPVPRRGDERVYRRGSRDREAGSGRPAEIDIRARPDRKRIRRRIEACCGDGVVGEIRGQAMRSVGVISSAKCFTASSRVSRGRSISRWDRGPPRSGSDSWSCGRSWSTAHERARTTGRRSGADLDRCHPARLCARLWCARSGHSRDRLGKPPASRQFGMGHA